MDSMGGAVQDVPCRGRLFHHLDVGFLLDAGDPGLAGAVGLNGGDEFAVRVHIEHRALQGGPQLVHLQDSEADVPDVLKGDQNILFARPFHGFHPRILQVACRTGLLPHPVAAIGQLIALEGDSPVKAGGSGGLIAAVDLLKDEHGPL